ncbi:MAG: hypothetical protein V1647_06675, partial [Pseudomonadota bacterium]
AIHWAKSMGAFLGYRFKHRFNVGLMVDYTSLGTAMSRQDSAGFTIYHPSSTTALTARYYEFSTNAHALTLAPTFYYTIYNGGRITIDAGLGVLYAPKVSYSQYAAYSTTLTSTVVENTISGSGGAFGFQLAASTAYYFTNYLGISFDMSYKYLNASSFTDANGNPVYFTYNNGQTDTPPANMTTNFSGIYFGLGMRFEFDINASAAAPAPEKTEAAADNSWKENKAPELNTAWEEAPVAAAAPADAGPKIDDLREIKKQIQRKYNDVKTSGTPDAAQKSERYKKLYNISSKLEKDWDQFTPAARKDKLEKIRTILAK